MRFELDRALAAQGLQSALAVKAPIAWACLRGGEGWSGLLSIRYCRRAGRVGTRHPATAGEITLRYGIMRLRGVLNAIRPVRLCPALQLVMRRSTETPLRHDQQIARDMESLSYWRP